MDRRIGIAPVLLLLMLVIALSVTACGGGGGSDSNNATACSANGNIAVLDSGGNPLPSVTVTAAQGTSVPAVAVYVSYANSTAALLAGYPPGTTNPQSVGILIAKVGVPVSNKQQFSMTFASGFAKATYNATWRFVAADASQNILGCQDLPVTFIIN